MNKHGSSLTCLEARVLACFAILPVSDPTGHALFGCLIVLEAAPLYSLDLIRQASPLYIKSALANPSRVAF